MPPQSPEVVAAGSGSGSGSELAERLRANVQFIHIAWGAAWFIGFGLMFLNEGPGDRTFVDLPDWLPLTVLMTLLVVAGVTTAVIGVRVFGRGAADEASARQAKWYGLAWLLSFVALMLIMGKLTKDVPHDSKGLLWGATTTGLVGALHLAGSAIWSDRTQLRLGIWVTVINVVGAMAGVGWQALVISVAGGGVSLCLGARGLLLQRRDA